MTNSDPSDVHNDDVLQGEYPFPSEVEPDSDHCDHHQHDERCGYEQGFDCDDAASDDCVHCDCCCTCLSCEYGPRDGMLMFPDGNPEIEALGGVNQG